jgi:hypothetical protein
VRVHRVNPLDRDNQFLRRGRIFSRVEVRFFGRPHPFADQDKSDAVRMAAFLLLGANFRTSAVARLDESPALTPTLIPEHPLLRTVSLFLLRGDLVANSLVFGAGEDVLVEQVVFVAIRAAGDDSTGGWTRDAGQVQ